jgi:acyl-CoA hydrolase
MEQKAPSESTSQLIHWMGIVDTNSGGFIHGGTVMKLADEAAGLAAIRHSGLRCVTAGMDRMTFLHRIHVGELVTFTATVNAAWRSSMEVGVRVESANPRTGVQRHTSTAYITMVALDEEGKPTEVPGIEAQTPDELRRRREAEFRRANRLAERTEILKQRETAATSA